MDRVILHCDLNSFYASVELLEYPELRALPVAVTGDPEQRHGVILAKNEPAKAAGVKTGEPIFQARRKCPDLTLLPAHHDRYRAFSRRAAAIYDRYTDLVEPFGIDESWLDVTGTLHLFGGDPRALADRIRGEIRGELGITASVGVSFNKIFAKLGSDYKKPDATTVISRENFRALVWPLPVTDLLFVGRAAGRTLSAYGIATIGDLAAFDRGALVSLLGKQGGQLWEYANGLDAAPVDPAARNAPPKSIGNGSTFSQDLVGEEAIRAGVAPLARQVARRLRAHGQKAATLQVTIRDPHFRDICRQKPLPAPTCVSRELFQAAMELIGDTWNPRSPIRALTLTAHSLVEEDQAAEQLDLFQGQEQQRRDKLEKLERTLDAIHSRYGREALHPAAIPPEKEP